MIAAHGGKLITRVLTAEESRKVLSAGYKKIVVSRDFILDMENIAIGAYSPLTGFLKRGDLESVIYRMRLVSGEVWTIPIFLSLPEKTAGGLRKGEKIIICEENGREVGLMRVEDLFTFHKNRWAREVFGTENREHPGVHRLFNTHDKLIGGDIWLIKRPDFEFEKFNLTPQETRTLIRAYGWKTVAGFQTRNVPHRAHEYLQKLALSITDGILIHPIIGWKKDGDFVPKLIIKTYKTLIDKYFPAKSVIFAGLATAMRYAGPREAVFHAIIRKNYGCTHFIVGRDHAGVGAFYGKYDAHRIFDSVPDLGITPLLLREPYYCNKCKEMASDKTCPHGKRWQVKISGTMIRRFILEGKAIPEQMVREEISVILRKAKANTFI